jgi:hypothetical protein
MPKIKRKKKVPAPLVAPVVLQPMILELSYSLMLWGEATNINYIFFGLTAEAQMYNQLHSRQACHLLHHRYSSRIMGCDTTGATSGAGTFQ